jgi:hypothetical protein
MSLYSSNDPLVSIAQRGHLQGLRDHDFFAPSNEIVKRPNLLV